nr:putative 3A [Enterovirus H]
GPIYHDLTITVEETPAPSAISDLLCSVDSGEVRDYCRRRGWIVPDTPTEITVSRDYGKLSIILQAVTTFVTIAGVIFLVYKLMANFQ